MSAAPIPTQNRNPGDLAPIFRIPLLAYMTALEEAVPHVRFIITETRRTQARQDYLYAQGREEPYRNAPVVTWTRNSFHRWGLAADLAMIRKDDNAAIWTPSSWRWVYKQVNPLPYGLKHLDPLELVHLEHIYADQLISDAKQLELVQT